jgi:hypothetical protein
MTGGPPTPPDTPGATRDSASKLKGNETSNVNNQGINNQGGVVAGNIYGYNLIIGESARTLFVPSPLCN